MTKRIFQTLAATAALVLVLSGCPTENTDNNGDGEDGLISGHIGATLAVDGVQVHTMDTSQVIPTYPNFTDTVTLNTEPSNGTATLTNGKLTFSFGTPIDGDLENAATVMNSEFSDYNNVTTTSNDAKAAIMSLTTTGNSGLLKMDSSVSIGGTNVIGKVESVMYIYVDKDVTVSGEGDTSTEEGVTYTYNDFTLAFKYGWNAVYKVIETTTAVGGSSSSITETISIADNTGLKWVYITE